MVLTMFPAPPTTPVEFDFDKKAPFRFLWCPTAWFIFSVLARILIELIDDIGQATIAQSIYYKKLRTKRCCPKHVEALEQNESREGKSI